MKLSEFVVVLLGNLLIPGSYLHVVFLEEFNNKHEALESQIVALLALFTRSLCA